MGNSSACQQCHIPGAMRASGAHRGCSQGLPVRLRGCLLPLRLRGCLMSLWLRGCLLRLLQPPLLAALLLSFLLLAAPGGARAQLHSCCAATALEVFLALLAVAVWAGGFVAASHWHSTCVLGCFLPAAPCLGHGAVLARLHAAFAAPAAASAQGGALPGPLADSASGLGRWSRHCWPSGLRLSWPALQGCRCVSLMRPRCAQAHACQRGSSGLQQGVGGRVRLCCLQGLRHAC
jgi:hypothetical protein